MSSPATSTTPLITADELLARGDLGRCELIDGKIVAMSPTGWEHGRVVATLTVIVAAFVRLHKLGVTSGAETGFVLARNPDRVRAPDVAFVRAERVPPAGFAGFFQGAPDLAIEVNSPSDRHSEVLEKVDEWLAAGATSCWVIDPPTKSVVIYRSGGTVVRHRIGDEIRDEPVLPGLVVKVDEIFD